MRRLTAVLPFARNIASRPSVTYHSSIPPPSEDYRQTRARSIDASRLRDIRKRLDAPSQLVSQAEIDSLATEVLDDAVALASDYIGNVVIQRIFEKCSTSPRVSTCLKKDSIFFCSLLAYSKAPWRAHA